ncbi:ExbD/TolR family protein [Pseudooceanicola sp. C21-150M6]|uniref:ExbD/TolR family protein n=1 Tax=Pseudooceanicola sp. C21-150M6 TaxID=3434355 RepID=UPI003D7F5FC5
MRLTRRKTPATLIPLVSMIDVLMILLVFFMVTSTFRNLDMLPLRRDAMPGGAGAAEEPSLFLRIDAAGRILRGGSELDPAGLKSALQQQPGAEVLFLPSGQATAQALVTALDMAAGAGATRIRVIRLEADP